jgi:predicted DNA-binding protein YlxM (UPF0122 family)
LDIKNYGGLYQVSNHGRIRSFKQYTEGRLLVQIPDRYGYMYLTLNDSNHVQKAFKVHRLVAGAFIPNPDKLPQVNHINGVKTDNRVENLEWCTLSNNVKHALRIGLDSQKGERNRNSKLSNDDVIEIYKLVWEENLSYQSIAEKYSISPSNVKKIKCGELWSHITNHDALQEDGSLKSIRRKNILVGEKNPSSKLNEKQVLEIKELLLSSNHTIKEIAQNYRVSKSAIEGIKYRTTWRHLI